MRGSASVTQAVEELPGAVAAQRDVGADRHALAQLELRDRLAGLGDLRLLTGDQREVLDGTVDDLGVASCLADTGVHDDLDEAGHLVRVRVAELLGERRDDLGAVLLLQARLDFASHCSVGHQSFSPDFFA